MKAHIDGAVQSLLKLWPSMFKPSERCRPPHLHRDTLRNKLFQTAATHNVGATEELVAMVLRVNEQLKSRADSSWPDRLRAKPLEKAKANDCFLGLSEYTWLDMLGS